MIYIGVRDIYWEISSAITTVSGTVVNQLSSVSIIDNMYRCVAAKWATINHTVFFIKLLLGHRT